MQVVLAGYNVDKSMLDKAIDAGVPRDRLTPEVLSAAYARISRDPRPVYELRQAALQEVEKARVSNRKIIFDMGHHSVAEHAVFNFDILGISRLAIEWLERFRLCSYTEKSQRYITLDHDYVIPKELENSPFEAELLSLVSSQTVLYQKLNRACRRRLREKHPDLEKKKSGQRLLDNWSKEDARYATLLATTGQLGLTANARNLELMVRRSTASLLAEVRDLGMKLHGFASEVAPSLLLFTEDSGYDSKTGKDLSELSNRHIPNRSTPTQEDSFPDSEAVRLVQYTDRADQCIAACLLHTFGQATFQECRTTVQKINTKDLETIFKTAMERMAFFDAVAREFEHVTFTFEITLSASAFAQLKRHRMTTQSIQQYDPALGVTVPPSIKEVEMERDFLSHTARCEQLFTHIQETAPAIAPYVLTNAHRRRVLMTLNLRELYHFVRLREDAHAQWDIRQIAQAMREQTEKVAPLGAKLLCGKDGYTERYKTLYDRLPAILPPSD